MYRPIHMDWPTNEPRASALLYRHMFLVSRSSLRSFLPVFWRVGRRAAGLSALAVLAAPLMASHAQSQPAASPAPQAGASAPLSKGEAKAIRQFHMLDFNGDGKLSRAEMSLVPKLAAAFDDADTDRDGYVTLEEVRAFAIKYRAERDSARAAAR